MSSESKLHQSCYVWFHNNYPKLRGLLCYNFNNSRNKIEGAKNKSLGLQAGRSDMVLYYNSKAYMIELKTSSGVQSKKQKVWQEIIQKQGFDYIIIRSLEEFKNILTKIIEKNGSN